AGAPMSGSESRRILAIDYGRKRIGVALSDELQMTAKPLLVLVRTNHRNDLRRLREICRKHGVARILVGHPLHITGEAGEMAEEAANFARRLQRELGIEVKLADERLTTWEAEQIVAGQKSAARKKSHVDDIAAAVLLREYLDRNRAHAGQVAAEKE
ncbi:MAG: Holliday junction resolvase RuvX, partial [Candidatus Acidiferrales bacterium]